MDTSYALWTQEVSMVKRLVLSLCVIALAAAPVASACTMQVTLTPRPDGNSQRVTWTPVPGATQYDIFEQTEGHPFRQIEQVFPRAEPAFIARPTATEEQPYEYLIVARSEDSSVSCVATTRFQMAGDERIAALTHKRIVPLVGSVRGANGADFRTSLLLRHFALHSGRIVFRPTGTIARDTDPSLRYSFADNGPNQHDLYWDDVVAAMGASGTGTLEIIPDVLPSDRGVFVPEVNARVYNVTPEGTFGSRVAAVLPSEWVGAPDSNKASFSVPPVHGNFRRNAGIRTITTLLYRVIVLHANGTVDNLPFRELPANYTWFGSVEALVGGAVPPDSRVSVNFMSGTAIGFYTETENLTNDPTVVIRNPDDAEEVTWSF
jgi:hypothetical protein